MRIGIISDTHSRYDTVDKVVALLREHGVDLVIHCGDIEDGEVVERLRGFATHFVSATATPTATTCAGPFRSTLTLHEPSGNWSWKAARSPFCHGDDKQLMRDVENSGHFDFLFYGHTHQAAEHRTGRHA